jgi:50S ribosomal subunit-associated GTPase HflX
MRALTGSEVLVADKIFATLDTMVRALHPEAKPRVPVSDTVGFIKKLSHDLVASFRSTLAEAIEASLLLFVVDAFDPTYESQLEVRPVLLKAFSAKCAGWSQLPSWLPVSGRLKAASGCCSSAWAKTSTNWSYRTSTC